MASTFDEYVASLSSSSRQTLRYSARRFFREPDSRFEVCDRRGDVTQLVAWISDIYARSWQARTFAAAPAGVAADLGLLERIADEGWLRAYVLIRNNRPVAYHLGLVYARVYYLLDCAYSREEAAASPGSVLTFRAIEELHNSGDVDIWDFGFGDMPYKKSFGNITHDAAIVYFVPRNRWRHILRLQMALNSSYDWIRSGLMRTGADRFVRKLVKSQK
jgi:hypothetical protein